eukprot:3857247-Rhodomonas_salina.3
MDYASAGSLARSSILDPRSQTLDPSRPLTLDPRPYTLDLGIRVLVPDTRPACALALPLIGSLASRYSKAQKGLPEVLFPLVSYAFAMTCPVLAIRYDPMDSR